VFKVSSIEKFQIPLLDIMYHSDMGISYETEVIGEGNHASLLIPNWVLEKLNTNKRAPLKITINGHTYQSTAVGVAGECRVVFPIADRLAASANTGDIVEVNLELDSGYREVNIPSELVEALATSGLSEIFQALSYSKRKEFSRQVSEAKAKDTKLRRISKVLDSIRNEKP
jgi:bifunctional DNA-binding transcriptional regulator/antitoxin component of YhaV-PrlF toxin-antitoxin module